MKPLFGKIVRNVSATAAVALGLSKRVDYRTLNRYILGINQMDDLGSILQEASNCLKEILNYKLFAVAVENGGAIDVWIDPSIYRKSFGKMIERDAAFGSGLPIRYLNGDQEGAQDTATFHPEQLSAHELSGDNFTAKLYVIPERRMFNYHSEIMGVIAQTIHIALSNHISIRQLENAAAIDPLTQCYNRREFDKQIERNIANAVRHKKALSLFMFDIDHFKKVNDRYGHQAGDEVLRKISEAIRNEIRTGDVLARYGGEEFIAILPETTKERAIELAERLRKVVENLRIKSEDSTIRVTASFGVSTLSTKDDRESLVKDADAMLYKAKASGRNVVMPGLIKLCRLDTQAETGSTNA